MASEQRTAPTKTLRERQRDLAELIVKQLLGNPSMASSAQYDRIVEAIAHYTLGVKEMR